MPPRVHLVRHAQGFHNLNVANHTMHDPLLTPVGIEQCRTLAKDFPYTADVDLVVASPLKRTVYTALYSFPEPIEKKKLKVIAMPELQETSDLPCDTGSDPEEIAREFQGKPLDTSALATAEGKHWNDKKGRWAPHSDAIVARAADARKWLLARPEKDIVVVTHGGFLHYFTEDWTGANKFAGSTGWANTEFRTYTFQSPSDPTLVETPESRERREGKEKPLSKEEQKNLQRSATKQWEHAGYQKAKEIQAKV
ncbi:PGAM-domain-containing protein [Myriangium duriaei CBS 260.36]|uniref:PGAM-domain-containing protein n=1 Tax=Myriangium duriaei CBS 260.36 TaxID=1168546 RepID=A0A9P4IST8_9PEZI|nr:PGAM-domain-containing protein [Myriangium duriaei CBS 260.36]